MRVLDLEQNTEEWLEARKGKITGTRPKKLFIEKIASKEKMIQSILYTNTLEEDDQKKLKKLSNKELEELLDPKEFDKFYYRAQKKEYWRILGEMSGYIEMPFIKENGYEEDDRERGHRLEKVAAEFLEREENIVTEDIGMCVRDDYEEIALSPDKLIFNEDKSFYEGGVEIKNPGIVNHLETVFCEWVPDEYWLQVIQYFVVTDIDYLYYVSHCPEVTNRPLYYLKIYRKDVEQQIKESLERQIELVAHLKSDMLKLTF